MLPLALASALLGVGCDSGFSPAQALPGTWLNPTSFSGTYTTITLATNGGALTGTGTRFIEAGPPAPFDIVGSHKGIGVTMNWHFPSGEFATYNGQLLTAERLHGVVLTGTGDTIPADFYHQ